MGKLAGLQEGLTLLAMQSLPPVVDEPKPDLLLEALNSLVSAVSGITIPEVKIDLNTAVNKLVKALSGVTFPEHPVVDLSPVVRAIEGITLDVTFPPAPEQTKTDPCPYTFEIIRNDTGAMQRVIATPGIIAPAKPKKSESTFE